MSLAELDELTNKKEPPAGAAAKIIDPPPPPPPPPPATTIKSDTPTPNDLEAARIKQENEQKAAEAEQQRIADEHIAAGRNADGTEKTTEQLAADKKAQEEEDNDLALWDDVDKLWGEELEVEYKDPTGVEVHPNSPEGIILREKAIVARELNKFESYMRERDPRSYEYILHRQAGGTDEDFFGRKSVTLPTYEEFQNSVDLKSRVVADSLRLKGVPEKIIKLTIDDAIKEKTLDPLADAAYKEVKTSQDNEIARLNADNAKVQATYDRNVKALDKALTEEVTVGTSLKIQIPEAKQAPFLAFVKERIQYDDATGNFFVGQPIDHKVLPRLLESLYLQFSGGNLSDLIQRSAQSQNVRRLRRAVDSSKETVKSGAEPATKRKLTLGEL